MLLIKVIIILLVLVLPIICGCISYWLFKTKGYFFDFFLKIGFREFILSGVATTIALWGIFIPLINQYFANFKLKREVHCAVAVELRQNEITVDAILADMTLFTSSTSPKVSYAIFQTDVIKNSFLKLNYFTREEISQLMTISYISDIQNNALEAAVSADISTKASLYRDIIDGGVNNLKDELHKLFVQLSNGKEDGCVGVRHYIHENK